MTIDLFIPILRQFLQVVGGILLAKGYFDSATVDAFVGLGVNVLVLVWWLFDRSKINRRNLINKYIADRE
ncbi:Pam3-gp28 family putative phage holin [Sinorhizobium sp. 22678]|uniref:Pam3-gp28 family putative phage holin n=1 Tax=Sinorhizobium sp. 22678 TaxID=3453955 RepID=UPI003F87C1AA